MHPSIFAEISLIIAFAAGVALVMRLIHQPLIIGHILTGILIGPAVLHLIKSPETIETFSNIGIALLLFIIGLGLNPKVVREVGKVAGIAGVVQMVITGIAGWAGALLLGASPTDAVFLGVAVSFSSTIIILKLLSDKKEHSRLYGKITIGILLLQDLAAAAALLFLTAQAHDKGFAPDQIGLLIGKGLLIVVPMVFIGTVVLPRMHKLMAGSQEFLFLFALGWGFGSAALFEYAGFSLEVGALVAGIALASLPYTQEISSRLRPLRDFFIVVFFIALGARLNFNNFEQVLPLVIISTLVVIVIKPLVVLTVMGMMGYTKRTSFKAAIALGQLSEFSLIFVTLGNKQHLASDTLTSVVTFVALISIAVSTYLIMYSESIFQSLEHHLTMFEHHKVRPEHESRHTYQMVLFGYRKGGHEFLKVFRQLGKRFVVVDYDPEVIDMLEHFKVDYVYGDVNDVELLQEIGIEKAKLIVSNLGDHETNVFLAKLIERMNPGAVLICHSDTAKEAAELYALGASYVMMPHYIGSEKIGAFIRKNGFSKTEFKHYREKHLAYLETYYNLDNQD